MDDYKQKLRLYIERSIDNVCPYEEKNLQAIYHTGFMQGVLIRMILTDNKNLEIFNKIVEENISGSEK